MKEKRQTMDLKVIVGSGCASTLKRDIQSKISELIGADFKLTECEEEEFADGERLVQIKENIRGADVYIVQSTNYPDKNYDVLLLMLQAAALASAGRLTAVLPYMGGLRQDRKDRPRVPITAALRAQQIEVAMQPVAQRHVMIMHPHYAQIQGTFRVPTDLLYPTRIFVNAMSAIVNGDFSNVVPVSPDPGSATLAEHYRKRLKTDFYAIGDKRRTKKDATKIHGILGEVKGKTVFIVDDIIDTAGSLQSLSIKLKEMGAKKQYAFVTHGVLAGPAIERINNSDVERVFITDSIPHQPKSLPDGLITVVNVGELVGEAIWRNNTNRSIHAIDGMFDLKTK